MDVVGSIGYCGQQIHFVDPNRFTYITGKSICIYDTVKGPRDMIWREEYGVGSICINTETNMIAIAPEKGENIELVNVTDQTVVKVIQNSSSARVIKMCFNREGNKIYALTGITDHKLIVWNTANISELVVKQLDVSYKYCSVDPTDDKYFCLYGLDGIMVGMVQEVLGNFTIKSQVIQLSSAEEANEPATEVNQHNHVNFVLWLPLNRILFGNRSGVIYEYNCVSKRLKQLSMFSYTEKKGGGKKTDNIVPSCAALSVSHMIIGTAEGSVYWYPLISIMKDAEDEPILDFEQVMQVAHVGKPIVSLTICPHFLTLVIGTTAGSIHKCPVEPKEPAPVQEDPNKLDPEESMHDKKSEKTRKVEVAHTDTVGNNVKDGIVLCVKGLCLDVKKFSGRSKSSLTMFVTGSHLGSLKFWRQPSHTIEPLTPNGRIRKSAPRSLNTLFSISLSKHASMPPGGADTPLAAPSVCALDFVTLPIKHGILILVGTVKGSVEVWSLEAYEHDDEDMVKDSSEMSKVVEDDEGGCLVRLEWKKLLELNVFQTAVSMLQIFSSSPGDQSSLNVAIGSDEDSHLYALSVLRNNMVEAQKGLLTDVPLEEGQFPTSMTLFDNLLYVFCASGIVFSIPTEGPDFAAGLKRIDTEYDCIDHASITMHTNFLILLSDSNVVQSVPFREFLSPKPVVDDETSMTSQTSLQKGHVHEDIVVIAAHSPNGKYFATGCVDGTVYVWRNDTEPVEIVLVNEMRLHSGSVLTLAFSSCSSLLISCGTDGSLFILTLEKPVAKPSGSRGKSKRDMLRQDSFQSVSELMASKSSDITTTPSLLTWSQQREIEKEKEIKAQHKFKAMGISAAVGEITHRLEILVAQNREREEIEQLERGDFVIDTEKRKQIEVSNKEEVERTYNYYLRKNLCNELRAARLRKTCWDVLQVKSNSLLPFSGNETPCVGRNELSVSSFSVREYTTKEQQIFQKVKRLRAMEVRVQRTSFEGAVDRLHGTQTYRCAWNTSLKGCPPSVTWIAQDGSRWPTSDIIEKLLANERAAETSGRDKEKEGSGAAGKEKGADGEEVPEEDEEGSYASMEDDGEIDESNILNLLYPPQAVRTQVQKRTQIVLVKEIIRQIRVKFNERYHSLYQEKEDIIASIASRNIRIAAILEDLRQNEQIFSPKLADVEKLGSCIVVVDEELDVRPYESAAARETRLAEEAEKRRLEELRDQEDIKGRALQDMMHGTLEVKRDVFAEASLLDRPEWMDTLAPTEMNEGQLKEFEAYQLKIKTLQEEQASYRKALEQEMKKLKNEVTDLCKAFDDKLDDLARLKILVNREILSQELYVSRIAFSMAKSEQTRVFLKKTEEEIQKLLRERNDLRGRIEEYSQHMDEVKHRISVAQEEERQMDKSFRRDLQNLCNNTFDQDSLKIFTQLYRRRMYPRGGYDNSAENYGENSDTENVSASASASQKRSKKDSSKSQRSSNRSKRLGSSVNDSTQQRTRKMKASKGGMSAAAGGGLGPMQQAAQALRTTEEGPSYKDKDPYYEALLIQEKQKKVQEAQIPMMNQLSMEMDCPEGFVVDQYSWSKLQELRNARIEKEIEAKTLVFEFNEKKKKLEALDFEESVLAGCINEARASHELAMKYLKNLDCNLDIVVCLQQGQDEADKDAVITDYSESLLLPIDILKKYNSRIKELGKEKIAVLSKIKQFRRKINLIDWEAKHHGLEARHYEIYLTDLQLFRVTRELQKVIREGADANQAKERLEKVSHRREYLNKDSATKLVQYRKGKDTLIRQLEERKQDCTTLEEKIAMLRTEVAACKGVKQSRDLARGGHGDALNAATAKMRKVVGRRHLVDTARAQAEEIDFLRQELDKMRQRTFPSFVRATRKRLTVDRNL